MDGKDETLPVNFGLVGGAITREGETLDARYCLRKYRCRTNLLMWEPVPKPFLSHPLPTKHLLKDIGIGPPFPLTNKSNHNPSTDLEL